MSSSYPYPALDRAPQPPAAKRVPRVLTAHGESRTDDYFWLRDRDDPDTLAHLRAENEHTAAVMAPTAALQQELYDEMLARIKETDLSVPVRKDEYLYYSRTEQGKQYGIHCRRHQSMDAPEEVLLDGNALAEGKPYFALGNFAISPDHKLLAYAEDATGDELYTLRVKDLATGELLADEVPNTYYGLEWANDNRTLFYVTVDAARRPYRLHRHALGAPVSDDALLYEETDERFTLHLGKTRSRRWIVMALGSFTTSEVHVLDADADAAGLRVIVPRRQGIEYDVEHHGDRFYLRVNDTGRNFRLVRCPVGATMPSHWEEIVPHRPQRMLESVDAFARHIVLSEREDGLEKLRVMPLDGGAEHEIEFPEPVYTTALGGNAEFQTHTIRFAYASLVTPASVYDYDVESRARELLKQTEVRGGYDPVRYESRRTHATAPDGTRIPISLVHRRGLERDGQNPLYLYGYGSYGQSMDPTFSSTRLSLLDRGYVFAIAHIRGGAELGKPWHDDGKLLKKWNTFRDFIAAAEHLIADGYTNPHRLCAVGGSAGGLLVGTVMNQRPELFRAIVAHVPFVDVLNTAQDPTLPLTVGEYEEWGDSNVKEFFDMIRSYSPYDNVEAKAYPHVLATAGLNDPRVSFWEPAKWVARLRQLKTDDHVVLLKTQMEAGHAGPSGRYERLKETAFEYAFLLAVNRP